MTNQPKRKYEGVKCGATGRQSGQPCKRPAGWGTDHPGAGRCKLHGGVGQVNLPGSRYSDLRARPRLKELVNQYAAVPSLHVGWDLLMGLTIARYARRPLVRLAGVLLPLAMMVSVVLTANHYLVDGVAGAAVAAVGLVLAERLAPRRTRAVVVPLPRPPS